MVSASIDEKNIIYIKELMRAKRYRSFSHALNVVIEYHMKNQPDIQKAEAVSSFRASSETLMKELSVPKVALVSWLDGIPEA